MDKNPKELREIDDLQTRSRIILQLGIPTLALLYYFIRLVKREWDIASVSHRDHKETTKSILLKALITSLSCFVSVSEPVFSSLVPAYWMFSQDILMKAIDYGFSFFFLVVCLVEMHLIRSEFSKTLPRYTNFHLHFWLLIFVSYLCLSTITSSLQIHKIIRKESSLVDFVTNVNVLVDWLRVFVYMLEACVFYKFPQDVPSSHLIFSENDDIQFQPPFFTSDDARNSSVHFHLFKNRPSTTNQSDRDDKSPFSLNVSVREATQSEECLGDYLDVKISEKVIFIQGKLTFQLLVLQDGVPERKIQRSMEEFIELEAHLKRKEVLKSPLKQGGAVELTKQESFEMDLGQKRKYMKKIVKMALKSHFFKEKELLEFFEVPKESIEKIENIQRVSMGMAFHKMKKDGIGSQGNNDQRPSPSVSMNPPVYITIPQHYYDESKETYIFIVRVTLTKINETWELHKRFKEFEILHRNLSSEIKKKRASVTFPNDSGPMSIGSPSSLLGLPKLPQKIMIPVENQRTKRRQNLQEYLGILASDPKYYLNGHLQEFLEIKEDQLNFVLDMTLDRRQIQNYQNHKFLGTKMGFKAIVPKSSKPFTVYTFKIEARNKENNSLEKEAKLVKRYKEFEEIDRILGRNSSELPPFPPKVSRYGFKPSNESRLNSLEKYLNALFEIPWVWECFAFRKFIGIDLSPARPDESEALEKLMHQSFLPSSLGAPEKRKAQKAVSSNSSSSKEKNMFEQIQKIKN